MQFRSGILVDAPLAGVFDRWMDAESYPTFMDEVVAVSPGGDGTVKWTTRVRGSLETWTAEQTASRERWAIEWRSSDGPWSLLGIRFAALQALTWVSCVLETGRLADESNAASAARTEAAMLDRWLREFGRATARSH